MNDIAELKARPVLDLTDSDSDGVIDMLDQEVDTPSGAPVDTRGVALDSDGDGVADYKDKEPYSPIGYEIEKDGVANVKKCESCLTEADVFRMIDSRTAGFKNDCGKWFLPMIHFDLDKSRIKPEFYGHLRNHVASALKQCPSACVAVVGHTDVRSSNTYNNMLSYNRVSGSGWLPATNYGIDRSRLKLMYGGEDAPMVGKSRSETEHYMNRRVEFRLCEATDAEMAKPEGKGGNSGNTSGNLALSSKAIRTLAINQIWLNNIKWEVSKHFPFFFKPRCPVSGLMNSLTASFVYRQTNFHFRFSVEIP